MTGPGDVEVTDSVVCEGVSSWRLEFASPLLDSIRGFGLEVGSVGPGLGISLLLKRVWRLQRKALWGHRKSLCLADRDSLLMFLMTVVPFGGSLQKGNLMPWASGRNSAV